MAAGGDPRAHLSSSFASDPTSWRGRSAPRPASHSRPRVSRRRVPSTPTRSRRARRVGSRASRCPFAAPSPATAMRPGRCASQLASSARSRRSTSRSTSLRTSSPRARCWMRRRPQARQADHPDLRAAPRGALRRGESARRVAECPARTRGRRRRRARRRSARWHAHLHGIGRGRLGHPLRAPRRMTFELGNASPVIVEPDADLELATTKVATHAFSCAGQTSSRFSASTCSMSAWTTSSPSSVPKVEALQIGGSGRRDDRCRASHRRRQPRPDHVVDPGGGGRRCRDRDGGRRDWRAPEAHRAQGRHAGDEGLLAGDLRPRLLGDFPTNPSKRRSPRRTRPSTGSRPRSSRARSSRPSRRRRRSSSAAS